MFLPEWYPQKGVLMAWPHPQTDWAADISAAETCYKAIIAALSDHEKVFLLCQDRDLVSEKLKDLPFYKNIFLINATYNDTWARDFGPIAILEEGSGIRFLDFGFNGWGNKFEAENDNALNGDLYKKGILPNLTDLNDFILEGGSIETDGLGTLLSTSHCLLAPNRNQPLTLAEIEDFLSGKLGTNHFLWLEHGYLAGDDTDSHIDTLARFCNEETICYVQCSDREDEHYHALRQMERQLENFRDPNGKTYRLVPLPMADPVRDEEGNRLPATYANFLISNQKVLVPVYGTETDQKALAIIAEIFPDRQVAGIDCTALIKQHGSLHCITMQIPEYDI